MSIAIKYAAQVELIKPRCAQFKPLQRGVQLLKCAIKRKLPRVVQQARVHTKKAPNTFCEKSLSAIRIMTNDEYSREAV